MANFCPNCGIAVSSSSSECSSCGEKFTSSSNFGNNNYSNNTTNKKSFSWSTWFFGFFVGIAVSFVLSIGLVGVLAAMAIPNFKVARASARQKACFSNQRVLQGAVEMYNMDVSPENMMRKLELSHLVSGNYLKDYPSKPEPQCNYETSGDLTETGYVYCTFHGDVNGKLKRR